MDAVAISVIALVAGAVAISAFFVDGLPARLRQRACQGAAWRRAFPDAPRQAIREFLSVFVDAFAFRRSHRLQFSPDDRIIDVYRLLHPKRWMPDQLELETFAQVLEERFAFSLGTVWSDQLTLGDVFRAVGARRFAA